MSEHPPASRRRPRRLALGLVVAALACCLLPTLVARAVAWRWNARARDEVARLGAEGLGVTNDELARPLPGSNGADDLRRAYGALEGLHECVSLVLGSQPEQVAQALRAPDDPEQGWMVHMRGHPDDPACPDLEGALAEVERRLARVERHVDAGLARQVVFPRELERGYVAELPHLMGVKTLAQGLVVRASHAMSRDRADAAWADVERILGLARAFGDDGGLIDRLVRHAVVAIGTTAIEQLLRLGPPPGDARRARLLAALDALDETRGFARCLRGELNQALNTLPEDAAAVPDVVDPKDLSRAQRLFFRHLYARWRADLVEAQAEAIRAAASPPAQVPDALAKVEERARQRDLLARLIMPALTKAYGRELRTQAQVRLVRVALELAAGGELPERLPRAPADPWAPDGATLRYARVGPREGTLWSRGPDRTDDAGRAPDPDAGTTLDTPGTDLVLHIALPAPR